MSSELNPVCVGIDVGQIHDPTAICVAECSQVSTGKHRHIKPIPAHLDAKTKMLVPGKETEEVMATEYTIRHIGRLLIGTSYPDVAAHIAKMLQSDMFVRRQLRVLMDVTGVGRPVYDQLAAEIKLHERTKHMHLKPISFVHGEAYNRSKGTLGKAFLVSRLQSLLQSGRVHGPNTKEMLATLEELRVYEIKVSQEGKDTYGASTGKHDDLATALCLACLIDPFKERVTYSERIY